MIMIKNYFENVKKIKLKRFKFIFKKGDFKQNFIFVLVNLMYCYKNIDYS